MSLAHNRYRIPLLQSALRKNNSGPVSRERTLLIISEVFLGNALFVNGRWNWFKEMERLKQGLKLRKEQI
jgi:hypothetical protein